MLAIKGSLCLKFRTSIHSHQLIELCHISFKLEPASSPLVRLYSSAFSCIFSILLQSIEQPGSKSRCTSCCSALVLRLSYPRYCNLESLWLSFKFRSASSLLAMYVQCFCPSRYRLSSSGFGPSNSMEAKHESRSPLYHYFGSVRGPLRGCRYFDLISLFHH